MPKSKSKDVAANFDPEFTANKTQFTKIDKRYIAQIDQSVRVTNTSWFSKGATFMGSVSHVSLPFLLAKVFDGFDYVAGQESGAGGTRSNLV